MMKRLIYLVLAVAFCLTSPTSALNIIWVSDAYTPAADFAAAKAVDPAWQAVTEPWDQLWVDTLKAAGHNVDYTLGAAPGNGYWRTLDDAKIAALNAADRVIISRGTTSGDYNNGDERTQWNSIGTPMILLTAYLARSGHWKWFNSTSLTDNGDAPLMDGAPPFDALIDDVDVLDELLGSGNTSFLRAKDAGNGLAIAVVDTDYPNTAGGGIDDLAGSIWMAIWDKGQEFYAGAGQTAGDNRMYFAAGAREGTDAAGVYWGQGMYNLTPEGEAMFLAAVATIPEPATIALLGLGGLALLGSRKRR
jgi:hypothetical protein